MSTEIMRRLMQAEEDERVRMLMAVESGSRSWGFESPNSDYDVRFVYAREPDWYLSVDLEDKRDVIEYPITDDIDMNGWDIRKALRLFWKSNPTIVEWIQSPVPYLEVGGFWSSMVELLPRTYSLAQGWHHYRSMANSNYRPFRGADQVSLKKYFYVLRPLLAVRWLEKRATPAPIEFVRLLDLVEDEAALHAIDELLEKKRASDEIAVGPAVPALNAFIESELEQLESAKPPESKRTAEMDDLNALFRAVLEEGGMPPFR